MDAPLWREPILVMKISCFDVYAADLVFGDEKDYGKLKMWVPMISNDAFDAWRWQGH